MRFRPPGTVLRLCLACIVLSASPTRADTPLERGRYLATIAACIGCHTPRSPGAPLLSGGVTFGSGPNAAVSANLTPDRDTGLGAWNDAEIVAAIREGRRPDGSRIRPPMPQRAYADLTDADANAIVAFLRSVPPVRNAIVRVPRDPARSAPTPEARTQSNEARPPSRGRYLFEAVAHCAECHTAPDGQPGRILQGPHGPLLAPKLTRSRLALLSDRDLATLVTTGTRPDGSRLIGPMPVAAYARLTPDDLTAVVAYVREAAP